MSIHQQVALYIVARLSLAADDERGEISATTIVLAVLLVGVAVALGGLIMNFVTSKAGELG